MSVFKVIALTGGPCGGKTSSISILCEYLESLGWVVYRAPETATLLFSGGVHFPDLTEEMAYSFQKSIVSTMIQVENSYRELAKLNAQRGIKSILICDRGLMDPSGYMTRQLWLKLLAELGLNELDLRDQRYDCVFHLVTCAKGAENFYNHGNATRSEGLTLARELDTAVMNAWIGHASFDVIDNIGVSNFNEKLDKLVQCVSMRLGLTPTKPHGRQMRKMKFLVSGYDATATFPISQYKEFIVEHRYLVNSLHDGTQTRIRSRRETEANAGHYTMTVRYPEVDGQRVEIRRNISSREFESYQTQTDPARLPVIKLRRCFLYNDRYFQLDVFRSPKCGLVLLEGYLDATSCDDVPEWLNCVDVVDDPEFSMFQISKREKTKEMDGLLEKDLLL